MRSPTASERGFGLLLAPLLALPLILFVFTPSFRPPHKQHEVHIETRLPYSGSRPAYVRISIDADDSVKVNGVACDAAGQTDLPVTLLQLKASHANDYGAGVMIQPQPLTRMQRIVDVLVACRSAGFQDIEFGSPPATAN